MVKSNLKKKKGTAPQFSTWTHFTDPESHKRRGILVYLRSDSPTLPKLCTFNLCLSIPQMDLWPFTSVTALGRNDQTSQGLLDTGSEQTLLPGDPKCHCGLPVTVGACGGKVTGFYLRYSSWWIQWVPNPSRGYFLSSRTCNWNSHTHGWEESPH